MLSLVLELQVVHDHSVAVLDAHSLQLVEQSRLAQLFVKPVAALKVAESGEATRCWSQGASTNQK